MHWIHSLGCEIVLLAQTPVGEGLGKKGSGRGIRAGVGIRPGPAVASVATSLDPFCFLIGAAFPLAPGLHACFCL